MNVRQGNERRRQLAQQVAARLANQSQAAGGLGALPFPAAHPGATGGQRPLLGLNRSSTGASPRLTFQPRISAALLSRLGPGAAGHLNQDESGPDGMPVVGPGHGIGRSVAAALGAALAAAGIAPSAQAGPNSSFDASPGGIPAISSSGSPNPNTFSVGPNSLPALQFDQMGPMPSNLWQQIQALRSPGSSDTLPDPYLIHLGNGQYYDPRADAVRGMPFGNGIQRR